MGKTFFFYIFLTLLLLFFKLVGLRIESLLDPFIQCERSPLRVVRIPLLEGFCQDNNRSISRIGALQLGNWTKQTRYCVQNMTTGLIAPMFASMVIG